MANYKAHADQISEVWGNKANLRSLDPKTF